MDAAKRLYSFSLLDAEGPVDRIAFRDAGVRRDLERLVIDALRCQPGGTADVAESILNGAAVATHGTNNLTHLEALDRFREPNGAESPPMLRRFVELAGRPSRWGESFAAATEPDGTGVLFRILVQVELGTEPRQNDALPEVEFDESFGRGVTDDDDQRQILRDAVAAAVGYLCSVPHLQLSADRDHATRVRVFRGGLPWPFERDDDLPTATERRWLSETHTGASIGLPISLALLHAFLPHATSIEGPLCAATGEVGSEGSVDVVDHIEQKAAVAAQAELRFLYPSGNRRAGRSLHRHVAVATLADAAAEVLNLLDRSVDWFYRESHTSIYGRGDDDKMLHAAWRRAQEGDPRLVVVAGPSGLGKSKLASHFMRELLQDGVPTVYGRATEQLSQVFEPIVERLGDGLTPTELNEHAPWITSVVDPVGSAAPEGFHNVNAGQASVQQKSRWIASLVRYCAERRGLVVFIDDLQWAKEETWPVISQLLDRTYDVRLLIVATSRGDHALASRDADNLSKLRVAGVVDDINLAGLPVDTIQQWVEESALPLYPGSAAGLAQALLQVTAGEPVLIGNHLQRLKKVNGLLDLASTDLEAMVFEVGKDILSKRLRTFEGLQALKFASAVQGDEFSQQLLLETSLVDPAGLYSDLRRAQEEFFIRAARSGRFTFVHESTSVAVRSLMSPEEWATVNLGLARTWERRPENKKARLRVADLANHYAEAAPLLDGEGWARAQEYAVRAAEEAMGRVAYEAVLKYRKLALEAFCQTDVDDRHQEYAYLYEVGKAYAYNGLEPDARMFFGDAIDVAVEGNHSDLVIDATLAFAGPPEDPGMTDQRLLRYLKDAVDRSIDPADARRLRLQSRLTFETVLAARRGDDESMPDVIDILANAREAGDPVQLAWALLARMMGDWVKSDAPIDRLELATEMVEVAQACDEMDIVAWGHAFRVIHLLELGRRDDAERAADLLGDFGKEHAYGYARWAALALRPVFAFLDGRFQESRDLAKEAEEFRSDSVNSVVYRSTQECLAFSEEGDARAANRGISRVQDKIAESFPGMSSLVELASALSALELGDLGPARAIVDGLVASGIHWPENDILQLTRLALLTEICAGLSDVRLVPEVYRVLKDREGVVLVVALAIVCLGAVDRYLGVLAGLEQGWDVAEGHFERALRINGEDLRSPVWAGHTKLDYARMLTARGRTEDRERARTLARLAHEDAGRLGMGRLHRYAGMALTELA